MNHLHPSAAEHIILSNHDRILKIKQDRWIGYTRATGILQKLEDLLEHPKILRMPNLLIVGDTNNGKTVLTNRFFSLHRPYMRDSDKCYIAPVVYIQAPPKPDEKRFYNNLLESLYIPYKVSDRVEHKLQQLIVVLRNAETRMLVIDEIHHILAGNMVAQKTFLNVIKYLANELQLVIVGVGIKDAFMAISTDAQLANRFEPVVLPKWRMNDDYLRLLASIEYLTPLKKPSNLPSDALATHILSLSEGTIGEIATVINKAAILAVLSGEERITTGILNKIDYIPPSKRKKQFDAF